MGFVSTLPRPVIKERTLFITQDGTTYEIHIPPDRALMYDTGTGMPEIEYVTQRGPFQDGESIKDYFLRPRVVEMRYRKNCCSRQEYWDARAELLNILRPNRGNTGTPSGTLRKILPDGTKRDLTVTIQQGPRYEAQKSNEWDQWSIDEVLRFIAYNPVYFDPDQRSQAFTTLGGFVFPITFPVLFASFGNTITIDYEGNWSEYPVIVITGPIDATSIINTTTDENIGLNYNIAAGRVVTIDLSYGVKSVTLDDGTNLIGYITNDSDLATFHLQPGNNVIQVLGTSTGLATTVDINWYNRYVGI